MILQKWLDHGENCELLHEINLPWINCISNNLQGGIMSPTYITLSIHVFLHSFPSWNYDETKMLSNVSIS